MGVMGPWDEDSDSDEYPPLPRVYSPLDNDFPENILGMIFRHLPPECYVNVDRTSEKWARVLDFYVGRVMIVKEDKGFMLDPWPICNTLTMKSYFWVSLSRNYDPEPEADADAGAGAAGPAPAPKLNPPLQIPLLPNPAFIRKIGLIGDLSGTGLDPQDLLTSLVTQCPKLRGLYLHLSVFISLYDNRNELWCLSDWVPDLYDLVIDSSGTSQEDLDQQFNYKHAFCALYNFLSLEHFRFLQKFILGVPYIALWEGALVYGLSNFLGRHSPSLRALSFNQKYLLDDEQYLETGTGSEEHSFHEQSTTIPTTAPPEMGDGDCRKKLTIYQRFPPNDLNYLSLKQLGLNAKELRKLLLQELHVVLVHPQESAPLWSNLLIVQPTLEKVVMAGDKIPLPVKTLEVSARYLTTVRLDVRDGISLKCFSVCRSLRHLTLRGKKDQFDDSSSEEEEDEDSKTKDDFTPPLQLTNAQSLPYSLKHIEVINLRTGSYDAHKLALMIPGLKELVLINLGWEGQLGLSLKDLSIIWTVQRLDHFHIKGSLNMMSLDRKVNRFRPTDQISLLASVLQVNSFVAASRFQLECWKDRHGFFTLDRDRAALKEEDEEDVFQVPYRCQKLTNDVETEYETEEEEEEEEYSSSSASASGNEEPEVDKPAQDKKRKQKKKNGSQPESAEEWEDCEDGL